jgi:hypothetical protein
MTPSRACLAVAVTFTSGVFALPARAQSDDDRATARTLGQDGQQALDAKDYRTAEDRFRRADKLIHAPTLMLGLARALAGEGKYVEAQETYNRIVREGLPPGAPDAFKRALEDAKKEVDGVAPKVAGVTITVKGATGADVADAKVVLDEHPVNGASLGVKRTIDPGAHALRVSADGYKTVELTFEVPQGGAVDEPVVLEAETAGPAEAPGASAAPSALPQTAGVSAPPDGGAKHSPLPWIAFGVGGAGLILGGVGGFIAMNDHSSLAKSCPNGACPPSESSNLSGYHTMGALSTAGFVLAGAGGAAGLVLLLTQPKAPSPAATGFTIAPKIGVGSIGAIGTF